MTRLHAFAVLVGLIAMIMAQLGGVELHHFVYGRCCQSESLAAVYVSSAMKVLAEILNLIPGFVTGFIARTREIVTGFITGLLGGAGYSTFAATLLLGTSAWHGFTTSAAVVSILSMGVVSGIAGAAAGGAGELVRSNLPLKRSASS
jgi:hypothetical protein